MKIDVTLLNVKDGDAIIVELVRANQTLVMVVDGGRKSYYETKMKPALELILHKHEKKAPDIVVCTHYDSDHIGGLIPLLKDYINDVKQVWVHKIPLLLNEYFTQATLILEEDRKLKHLTSPKMLSLLNEVFDNSVKSSQKLPEQREQVGLLLESITELKQLIDLIPEDKLVEPFNNGETLLPDWPEVKILGPTPEYYNALFPPSKSLDIFLTEELMQQRFIKERDLLAYAQRLTEIAGVKSVAVSSCEKLKKDNNTSLTATNKASIIFAIKDGSNQYLFTGDAGIESFKKIPNWEQQLKELYFLKVPHHGSSNNLTEQLIELMQPSFAYCSGDKYQDDEVLDCLKSKGSKVHTTKLKKDLIFDNTNPS
ncbi:MAG: MBL fold metallo-hydrolase [Sphingobacteriaceae bacterium]|nr:MAG: MBL fold metallo-hydrolase [Sphingobacteriaceae bacterium]